MQLLLSLLFFKLHNLHSKSGEKKFIEIIPVSFSYSKCSNNNIYKKIKTDHGTFAQSSRIINHQL